MDGPSRLPSSLPAGRTLKLPGRGQTWIYDTGEPRSGPDAPAVLLLHGWTSSGALNWYRCFPALREKYRVVALDHRGHGRGIRSRLPFRLEDCADDAAAVVAALGVGPLTAVGYSMGGPIAQLLWRRHPEAVDGLVLCATAARFATRRQFSGPLGTLGLGASMALSLLPGVARRQGMGMVIRRWNATASAAGWALEEWARHDPSALMQAGLALSRFDSTSWVGSIDVPTAVVVTEADQTVSPRRQRFLADHIPGALAFPVEGDHRACVDVPRRFVPALLAACEAVRHPGAVANLTGN